MPFLGRVLMPSNAVSSGELVINDVWKHIHVRGRIVGYSGAGIARMMIGGTSIDGTGTCASSIFETATNNVTSVSAAGWPLGVAAITGTRYFTLDIINEATIVKRMIGASNNNSVSAATAPIQARFVGIWVNTSAAIQRLRLSNFDVLTGTTLSANTLTAGTTFDVWGHNDDGG
jgi:hypothetical protein